MKVRMKVTLSGTRNGEPWPGVGQLIELPDQEGADLCAGGMAEPVASDKVEKAVQPPAEERAGDADPKPPKATKKTAAKGD